MIRIEGLTKAYGERAVVDRVSLVVEAGQIAALVGTSGSGKTTLLRMINRLVEPTAGRIWIGNTDTMQMEAHLLRRRIGYAIQGHGLFPHRTVGQNIATVPRLLGWAEAEIAPRVEELLHMFQLDPAQFRDRMPHELSGGQQQRVGVARALAVGVAYQTTVGGVMMPRVASPQPEHPHKPTLPGVMMPLASASASCSSIFSQASAMWWIPMPLFSMNLACSVTARAKKCC